MLPASRLETCLLVHPHIPTTSGVQYFAFSIPGIGQLQPTRMPQGAVSSAFSMTELMYLVLGKIPPLPQEDGTWSNPEPLFDDSSI
jgi:hypothetical protein